ncbi:MULTISPECIES: sensor histidine kinase [Geobacter]|uniref:sensor histidine kinase n=1 Tax=Geobacter TaxID=28231 RepID=UPI0025733F32|nr:PAS domain S-box protein [Geobacter sulfurreducens]BEH11175.1 PAS domain S-box protein [Geobacter sulfurreducens subsp. ethanolicus]BET59024.1 PAS domain S-box protein [Geobacter sp. 60473]
MKLRTKLIILVSILVIILMVVTSRITLGYLERHLHDSIAAQQTATVVHVATDIDSTLRSMLELLTASARVVPPAALADPSGAKAFLESRTGLRTLFNNHLFVVDAAGNLLAEVTNQEVRRVENFSGHAFFNKARATRKPLISELTTCCTGTANLREIVFISPILGKNGSFKGALLGGIDLSEENSLSRFGRITVGNKGFTRIIDRNHMVLIHAEREHTLIKAVPEVARLVDAAREGYVGTRETKGRYGDILLTSVTKLGSKDWVVAASYPLAVAYEPVKVVRRLFIISTVVAILGVLVVVSLSMQYLTRPILALERHINELSGKKGKERLVPVSNEDELSRLTETFNTMLAEIDRQTESLRESEDRFRGAFEQAAVGMAIIDREGLLIRTNRRFCDIAGRHDDDLAGLDCLALVHPEDRSAAREIMPTIAATEGEPLTRELRFTHGTGRTVWANTAFSPVRGRSGPDDSFIMVVEDVTERKRAEEEILRLNSDLEQRVADRTAALENANRELEAFSYTVSHDLKAPARHISGIVDMVLEDWGGCMEPAHRELMERVAAAAGRMQSMIDGLLELSRVGSDELRRQEVRPADLAREVCIELAAAEPARQVDWSVKDVPPANADPELLMTVLENLLGNAWKYTSRNERAEVEFGCEYCSGKNMYYVKDNGAGFDIRDAQRLFAPFQRFHPASEFEGNGIGLATVARIIHRHGGTIRAESAPGRGATFYFSLD